MESNYIELNKLAYDKTALEFKDKILLRRDSSLRLAEDVSKYLTTESSILELGPGSGDISRILSEKGFDVSMIEFSEKMAVIAKETAPLAKIIVDDFLIHDFNLDKFDCILGFAFLHLFQKKDLVLVLKKVKSLLNSKGVAVFSSTKNDSYKEGYFEKVNFKAKSKRFRIKHTKESFTSTLIKNGFKIIDYVERSEKEDSNKVWMTFVVTV